MKNNAYLGPVLRKSRRTAQFGVRQYEEIIRPGSIFKTEDGASVYVMCMRLFEFPEPKRSKMTVEQLARNVVTEGPYNWTVACDVEGDVDAFQVNTEIYVHPKPGPKPKIEN